MNYMHEIDNEQHSMTFTHYALHGRETSNQNNLKYKVQSYQSPYTVNHKTDSFCLYQGESSSSLPPPRWTQYFPQTYHSTQKSWFQLLAGRYKVRLVLPRDDDDPRHGRICDRHQAAGRAGGRGRRGGRRGCHRGCYRGGGNTSHSVAGPRQSDHAHRLLAHL